MYIMRKKIKKIITLRKKIKLARKNGSFLHRKNHVDIYTSIGKGSRIMQGNIICSTTIGNCTTIGSNNILGNVFIGSFCSIGSNVYVLDSRHPFYKPFVSSSPCFYKSLFPMPLIKSEYEFNEKLRNESGFSVEIGNDVWIGTNVIIIGKIKIGDGSVVGAGSVVTKDVDPYSVVAGNPAKKIKDRYDTNIIAKLLKIQWWNWPLETIKDRKADFNDLEIFLKKYETK